METTYLVCAIAGGSILILQFALQWIGGTDLDADVDCDPTTDVAGEGIFKLLSIQTVVAGIAFFGLAGMTARQAGVGPGTTLAIATGSGLLALFLVGWILSMLLELQSNGTIDFRNTNGAHGTCYLRVPDRGRGVGRVHIQVQGRVLECKAVSDGQAIPTGANVEVVALRGPRTVVVRNLER